MLLKEFLLAKEAWGIPIQALLRRLYDLGIVQQGFYQNTFRIWSSRSFRKDEPERLDPENSYRLRQLVYRALAEGLVTPSRVAGLLGVGLRKIEDVMGDGQPVDGADAYEDSRLWYQYLDRPAGKSLSVAPLVRHHGFRMTRASETAWVAFAGSGAHN